MSSYISYTEAVMAGSCGVADPGCSRQRTRHLLRYLRMLRFMLVIEAAGSSWAGFDAAGEVSVLWNEHAVVDQSFILDC